jgi:hypothetical protein
MQKQLELNNFDLGVYYLLTTCHIRSLPHHTQKRFISTMEL